MAGSPDWKVYRQGEYVAAFKHAEDAAAFVAVTGGEVRYGHGAKDAVWREGSEEFSASESYDRAAELMHRRRQASAAAYRASVAPVRLGDLVR